MGVALCALAIGAASETRRVEAIGAAPAAKGAGAAARDAAQRAAIFDALVQVGLSLLPPETDAEATRPRVAAALTGDPRDYTSRYRVVEDRGVGPRTVLTDPAVVTEYVVRVEAQVDVARVRAKLGAAGVPLRPSALPVATSAAVATAEIRRFPLVVEGLTTYRTYAAVKSALVERAGARSARATEFARGRAVLEVETTQTPDALARALPGALAPEILVEPLPTEGEIVRIRVTAAPPAPPAAPAGAAPAAEPPPAD